MKRKYEIMKEQKYYDKTTLFPSTPVWQTITAAKFLFGLGLGTNMSQRLGIKIRVRKLILRILIDYKHTNTIDSVQHRIIIFRDGKGIDGQSTPTSRLLENNTNFFTFLNHGEVSSGKIEIIDDIDLNMDTETVYRPPDYVSTPPSFTIVTTGPTSSDGTIFSDDPVFPSVNLDLINMNFTSSINIGSSCNGSYTGPTPAFTGGTITLIPVGTSSISPTLLNQPSIKRPTIHLDHEVSMTMVQNNPLNWTREVYAKPKWIYREYDLDMIATFTVPGTGISVDTKGNTLNICIGCSNTSTTDAIFVMSRIIYEDL